MKLYLVLYLLGNVILSVGPWSDGSDELCKAAAVSLQADARKNAEAFADVLGKPVKPADITGDCIKSEKTPYIKDAVRLN